MAAPLTLFYPHPLFGQADLTTTAPCLQRMLCRGRIDTHSHPDPYIRLATLFGLPSMSGQDPPVALSRLLAAGQTPAQGTWLCADPVRLIADQNGLLLSPIADRDFDRAAAQGVATVLKEVLQPMQLHVLGANRWCLHAGDREAPYTTSLPLAAGRDVRSLLPRGKTAHFWHRLLTECQMVLHSHAAREDSQHTAPNSLWFWGSGTVPSRCTPSSLQVFSNDPLCQGLASLTKVAMMPLPKSLAEIRDTATPKLFILASVDSIADAESDRMAIEQAWFAPALQGLQNGALTQVTLSDASHVCTVTRKALWQLWRRRVRW